MRIRRETPQDIPAIRTVHTEAFATPPPGAEDAATPAADGDPGPGAPAASPVEVGLVDALRRDTESWLSWLSLVAVDASDAVVGHVVCSRAWVGDVPALGLGPLGVLPDRQRRGIGGALMHAVLAAADARDEPLVALLGHTSYYPRFGFRAAEEYGITPPDPEWGAYFQVRTLSSYEPKLRGPFVYARPFREL